MLGQQRIVKAVPSIRKSILVPFSTPIPSASTESWRISSRLLIPGNYNIKSSQFFQSNRLTKSTFSVLDLRQLTQIIEPFTACAHHDVSGSYLFMNFKDPKGNYKNTAVVFSDGTLVTWYMDKDSELQLASDILSFHSKSTGLRFGKESLISNQLSNSEWSESMVVNDQTTPLTSRLVDDGESLSLTEIDSNRSNEMLTVSMALATAARMNVIESQLQEHIDSGHAEISRLLQSMSNWKLSKVSETIFESEKLVHNWRYFLTQNGIDDIPDSLWDYEALDKLYVQVVSCFDVHKRFNDINTDITYYSEFLSTCGEHVRHKYSSRLEKIIIIIIAIEAGIAMRHLILDLIGSEKSDNSADIVPVRNYSNK